MWTCACTYVCARGRKKQEKTVETMCRRKYFISVKYIATSLLLLSQNVQLFHMNLCPFCCFRSLMTIKPLNLQQTFANTCCCKYTTNKGQYEESFFPGIYSAAEKMQQKTSLFKDELEEGYGHVVLLTTHYNTIFFP